MNLNYEAMLEYVHNVLVQNEGIKSPKPQLSFRNRFEHIKRVYGWAKRIIKGVDDCDESLVFTATIFHDCGYVKNRKDSHAKLGAEIFEKYALENKFDKDFINKVSYMIKNHSNKSLLKEDNTPIEFIILLEADLMDEEGAMGLVFDLLAEGTKLPESYSTVFNEIMIHSAHILEQDFMVTPLAVKFWNEKKKFINDFINNLKFDLFMEY